MGFFQECLRASKLLFSKSRRFFKHMMLITVQSLTRRKCLPSSPLQHWCAPNPGAIGGRLQRRALPLLPKCPQFEGVDSELIEVDVYFTPASVGITFGEPHGQFITGTLSAKDFL